MRGNKKALRTRSKRHHEALVIFRGRALNKTIQALTAIEHVDVHQWTSLGWDFLLCFQDASYMPLGTERFDQLAVTHLASHVSGVWDLLEEMAPILRSKHTKTIGLPFLSEPSLVSEDSQTQS